MKSHTFLKVENIENVHQDLDALSLNINDSNSSRNIDYLEWVTQYVLLKIACI